MATLFRILNEKLSKTVLRQMKPWKPFSTRSDYKFIIKGSDLDVQLPTTSVHEFLQLKMANYHNYVAVECSITNKKYTYEEIRIKSINLGKALRKNFKLKPGDVVGMFMQNDPDAIVTIMGVLNAGLVFTTMNPLYTPSEVSKQIVDANVKLLVTQCNLYNVAKEASRMAQMEIPIITAKQKESDMLPYGGVKFQDLVSSKIDDLPDLVPRAEEDVAFLLYSSGTTGLPKGVQLTHFNILTNIIQMNHSDFNISSTPPDQDVILLALPIYHIFGLSTITLTTLFSGGKLVSLPKFTPATFCDSLKKYRLTQFHAAPPLILYTISSPDVKPEYFSKLKCAMSGAAPLKNSDEVKFLEKFNNGKCLFRQGYGLTETSPGICLSTIEGMVDKTSSGSVGKLLPGTLAKVVDPNDPTATPLGPNVNGELLVKGPQVMKGYLNRPEDNEKAFQDGWFRTGDLVNYNEDENFFITDRIKELIKVKGFQVAPAELEGVIRTFPPIEDVGVIGIPHETYGEVPRAYVVIKKDHKFRINDLEKYVHAKVAKFKHLVGGVKVVDAIPKNPSGKILRRELKRSYQEKGI